MRHPNPKVRTRTYFGEVDEFAVYCPELGNVYLIPIEDLPTTHYATLRVEPTRNRQAKNVRLAGPYEIGHVEIY